MKSRWTRTSGREFSCRDRFADAGKLGEVS